VTKAQQEPQCQEQGSLTISLPKMTPGDDMEAFLEAFESTAEACVWPHAQWAVRLLPLLTREGLSTAQALMATGRSFYMELRRALLDRLHLNKEGHQQHS